MKNVACLNEDLFYGFLIHSYIMGFVLGVLFCYFFKV